MKFFATAPHHCREEIGEADSGGSGTPVDTGSLPDSFDDYMASLEDGGDAALASEADPAPAPVAAAPTPTPAESFTLKVNGQDIQATRDQMVQWAQLGRNYPQRVEQVKAQVRQEIEAQFAKDRDAIGSYKKIDEYAQQNPQWWSFVENQYQQALQNGTLANAPSLPPEFKKEFDELKGWKQGIESKLSEAQQQAEDEQLNTSIRAIRDEYPTLAWDQVDENGHNLETRVILHAQQKGIGDFGAAFRDMNFSELIKLKTEHALMEQQRAAAARRKQGIIGSKPTPTAKQEGQGPSRAQIKKSSYGDLAKMAIAEIEGQSA